MKRKREQQRDPSRDHNDLRRQVLRRLRAGLVLAGLATASAPALPAWAQPTAPATGPATPAAPPVAAPGAGRGWAGCPPFGAGVPGQAGRGSPHPRQPRSPPGRHRKPDPHARRGRLRPRRPWPRITSASTACGSSPTSRPRSSRPPPASSSSSSSPSSGRSTAIQLRGNRNVETAQLRGVIDVKPGEAIDPFRIALARTAIENLYRDKNYPLAHVDVDSQALADNGDVVLRHRRRPARPRPQGRTSSPPTTCPSPRTSLRDQVKTAPYIFIFRPGKYDPQQVEEDVASLRRFYESKGFFDARVGRKADLVAGPVGGAGRLRHRRGPAVRGRQGHVRGEHRPARVRPAGRDEAAEGRGVRQRPAPARHPRDGPRVQPSATATSTSRPAPTRTT